MTRWKIRTLYHALTLSKEMHVGYLINFSTYHRIYRKPLMLSNFNELTSSRYQYGFTFSSHNWLSIFNFVYLHRTSKKTALLADSYFNGKTGISLNLDFIFCCRQNKNVLKPHQILSKPLSGYNFLMFSRYDDYCSYRLHLKVLKQFQCDFKVFQIILFI